MTHVQWFLRLLVFSIFSSVRNMTCFRESIRTGFSGKMRDRGGGVARHSRCCQCERILKSMHKSKAIAV